MKLFRGASFRKRLYFIFALIVLVALPASQHLVAQTPEMSSQTEGLEAAPLQLSGDKPKSVANKTPEDPMKERPVPDGDAGAETKGTLSPLGIFEKKPSANDPSISLHDDMEKIMREEALRVREEFQEQARSLFERTPLGFDLKTINRLRSWALSLPLKFPVFIKHVLAQRARLGWFGFGLLLIFLFAVGYSLFGQKRMLKRLEHALTPLQKYMPEEIYPYIISMIKILVTSLIPLLLFGIYSLIQAFIRYQEPWFLIIGRLLMLWSLGALLINLGRESLTRNLFPVPPQYGRSIFRTLRVVIYYILFSAAVFLSAEALNIPEDFLALLGMTISLSIVFVLLLLMLKKKTLLSLLPELPYRSYEIFKKNLEKYYFPAIFLTFLTGLLWCVGYKTICKFLWMKTWAVAGAFLGIMLLYHFLQGWLRKWIEKKSDTDKPAQFLYQAVQSLLVYTAAITILIVVLDLLGLFEPIKRVMSFPVLNVGQTPLSLWTLVKVAFIMFVFMFISRLIRAWLDYKVYPSIKVEEGLAYAINTFLSYLFITLGFLFSLRVIGLDLRVLMVFAGALGIGIGLGFQNMAANLIAGFSLIFGRRIRKGDWIQVGDTVGKVQEVTLRATKVVTRDHIEYLIPNSELTSSTIVNYTLTEPLIRLHLPVGVSYNADPRQVEQILLKTAEENPNVSKTKKSKVWFAEYGDSSINFELLTWIDIRHIGRGETRSQLYFAIFQALAEANIEIPFPQRDLHVRSGLFRPDQETKE